MTRILINRNYALLWSGQAISLLGDQLFFTALALWIAADLGRGQDWAPVAVSGVLLAWSIPMVVIAPWSGVFVDRWDKRRTMLFTDVARAAVILVLLPIATAGLSVGVRLTAVYLAIFLVTVGSQFFLPSRTALIGDIVPEAEQARASGLAQTSFALAVIMGPPLAGVLLVRFGMQAVLLIDAVSFFASFAGLLAIRVPTIEHAAEEEERTGFVAELRQGLQFFRGSRVLMVLLVTSVVAMLGVGALNALDVFFVLQNLHAAPALYGFITGAFGVGSLAGAVVFSVFAERVGLERLFSISIVVAGLLEMAYSRLTSVPPAVVIIFLLGFAVAGLEVTVMPLLLRVTPRNLIGRVSSVLNPVGQTASIISVLASGLLVGTVLRGLHQSVLGTTFGPVDTIFFAGSILLTASGVYALLALRGAGREPLREAGITPIPSEG